VLISRDGRRQKLLGFPANESGGLFAGGLQKKFGSQFAPKKAAIEAISIKQPNNKYIISPNLFVFSFILNTSKIKF
jgi:hypothetical protein